MGTQQPKTEKSVKDVAKKAKNPASAMQAVMEAEPLAQLADPMALQRAMANPRGLSPKAIPGLQRKFGNQYVQMMLAGAAQRQSPSRIAGGIQAQMVEDYAQQPDNGGLGQITQRAPDADGGVELPDSMSDAINQGVSAGGKSLPQDAQVKMKQDLGIANPDQIQVHHDATADALSKSLGAKAFTAGSHIFFRQGEYDPGSAKGQSLLYHESVHTMQQGGTKPKSPQTKMTVNPPGDKYEQEADTVTEQAMATPEPGGPRFAAPNTAPSAPGQAPEDEGAAEEFAEDEMLPTGLGTSTMSPLQMDEDEGEEKEKEEKEKKEEAKEEGDKVASETKEKGKKSKEGAKESAKEKGEKKQETKEKKTKEVPKSEKAKPPEKIDPQLPQPEPEVDSTEVKYEPEAELGEPEMAEGPRLPTWEELAAGTVQMSPEDVKTELDFYQQLIASGEEEEAIAFPEIEVGAEATEAAGAEELDRGQLIGDALAEGALAGFQEGITEFVADQIVEAATSKIPFADGFINMAKIAHDPGKWAEDNVLSIGTGAVDMVKGFAAIGDEDTAWGYMAATLEAIVGVIDLANSIVGLINTIFQIIMAVAYVMTILGKAMVLLAPTAPFCILCWMAVPGNLMITVGDIIISFVKPINEIVSSVGNVLNAIKYLLQPLIILFRTLDLLETKADPEKLKEKQGKLKDATKGFVKSATQRMANTTVDAAKAGINHRKERAKAEEEAKAPRKPTESEDECRARQQAAADKLKTMPKTRLGAVGKTLGKGAVGVIVPGMALKGKLKEAKETWATSKRQLVVAKGGPKGKKTKGVEDKAKAAQEQADDAKKQHEEAAADTENKKKAHKQAADEEFELNQIKENRKKELDDAKKNLSAYLTGQKDIDQDPEGYERAMADLRAAGSAYRDAEANHKWSQENTDRKRSEYLAAVSEEAGRKKTAEDAENARYEAWKKKREHYQKYEDAWKEHLKGWGGQRHGYGITGASGSLFEVLKDRLGITAFSPDWFKEKLGFEKLNKYLFGEKKGAGDWLTEAETALDGAETETDATKKQDYMATAAQALGKIDIGSLRSELDTKQRVATADWHFRERITELQDQIARYDALTARLQALGAAPRWGEEYGIKPMTLKLEAIGLPAPDSGYARSDPGADVFVIQIGEKGGATGPYAAAGSAGAAAVLLPALAPLLAGGAIAAAVTQGQATIEIGVKEIGAEQELMVYEGLKVAVKPKTVWMKKNSSLYPFKPVNQEVTQSAGAVSVKVTYQPTAYEVPLHLSAEGLPSQDGYERSDPSADVFVVKTKDESGGDVERKVNKTSSLETLQVYLDRQKGTYPLVVEPKPVGIKSTQDNKRYEFEPEPDRKSVSRQDDGTHLTQFYEAPAAFSEPLGVSRAIQRSPMPGADSAALDDVAIQHAATGGMPGSPIPAAGPTNLSDIDVQRAAVGKAMTIPISAPQPASQGDMVIQRAPADEEMTAAEPALPEAEPEAAPPEEEELEFLEEEEEKAEVVEEESIDPFAAAMTEHRIRLFEQLPPPPEGAFEHIQGAAVAYTEVENEERGLYLQQQQIGALQAHTMGQLAEVQGTRVLTVAHQKGVAQQQADADTKLEAQDQMAKASSSQEAGAQETADQGGGAMSMFTGIFSKIIEGLGLPIGGGSADPAAAKEGTQKQADQTKATAETTKDATKLSQKRTTETQKVKADAAGVQDELGSFDDEIADKEAGTQEGLDQLGEAQAVNEEQIATTQGEKERLVEEHASALAEAEVWAIEHRTIRENIMSDLEASLTGGGEETAGEEME